MLTPEELIAAAEKGERKESTTEEKGLIPADFLAALSAASNPPPAPTSSPSTPTPSPEPPIAAPKPRPKLNGNLLPSLPLPSISLAHLLTLTAPPLRPAAPEPSTPEERQAVFARARAFAAKQQAEDEEIQVASAELAQTMKDNGWKTPQEGFTILYLEDGPQNPADIPLPASPRASQEIMPPPPAPRQYDAIRSRRPTVNQLHARRAVADAPFIPSQLASSEPDSQEAQDDRGPAPSLAQPISTRLRPGRAVNYAFPTQSTQSSQSSQGEMFPISHIIRSELREGRRMYLVRWEGYGEDRDSWEPWEGVGGTVAMEEFQRGGGV